MIPVDEIDASVCSVHGSLKRWVLIAHDLITGDEVLELVCVGCLSECGCEKCGEKITKALFAGN
jgi:hypothetical protein